MNGAIIYFKKLVLNLKAIPVQQLRLSDDQLYHIQSGIPVTHPVADASLRSMLLDQCICPCQLLL